MLDDNPEEFGLALGNEFLDKFIVIAFEVAEGEFNTFLVDGFELGDWLFIFSFSHHCELAGDKVLFGDEVVSQVAEIFEECAFHEGDLILNAGKLCDFVDEVKEGGWDAHDLVVHDLEEFPQEKRSSFNEVNGVGFLLGALDVIGLGQQKLLHLDVSILAEQLQEPEDPAESQLVVLLVPHF